MNPTTVMPMVVIRVLPNAREMEGIDGAVALMPMSPVLPWAGRLQEVCGSGYAESSSSKLVEHGAPMRRSRPIDTDDHHCNLLPKRKLLSRGNIY
ncbi:hypothetical protein IFU01_10250 [Oxalobacteraceae sp. CFBP 8763]|nr:hypothetical protein [Oxalobacteraceae sp. CFBP 8763]